MENVKEKILELLRSTNREGMDKLISYMEGGGFFTSPASTKYHGCYPGGLAAHSLNVYERLNVILSTYSLDVVRSPGQICLPIKPENVIIAALLHDLCKMGAYLDTDAGYKWCRAHPAGHALLSLKRLIAYIKLEELEIMMIRYHMGVYGLFEFEEQSGEYHLRGDDETKSKTERYGQSLANAWYHNPVVKFMYFCDELSALEEKEVAK